MTVHLVIPLVHFFRYPHINQSPRRKVAASTRATTSSGYSYPVNVFLRKCCYRLHRHCLICDRCFDAILNGHMAVRASGLAGPDRGLSSGNTGPGPGLIRCRYRHKGNTPGLLPVPVLAACGAAGRGRLPGPGPGSSRRAETPEQGPGGGTFPGCRFRAAAAVSVRSGPVRCGCGSCCGCGASAVLGTISDYQRAGFPGAHISQARPWARPRARMRVGVRAGARISCRARALLGAAWGRRRCCGSWTR